MISTVPSSKADETFIHKTALVEKGASLGENVFVGPYCTVGKGVSVGKGTRLHSHVVLEGRTEIGEGCQIFPFASIGHAPQDKKYKGEPSRLVIGSRNIIREYVTIQPGTEDGGMETIVGNDCLFMASTHIAHDCRVGDRVVMANLATLGGHVHIGSDVVIGGLAALHQFVRVGNGAFISGKSAASRDIIPYGFLSPDYNILAGLNLVGLKRSGVESGRIGALRKAYDVLMTPGGGRNFDQRAQGLSPEVRSEPLVQEVIAFVQEGGRPLCLPRQEGASLVPG